MFAPNPNTLENHIMMKLAVLALALLLTGPALAAEDAAADKPAIATAQTMTLSAQIVALDKEARTVTLKGPQGNLRTIEVGPEVKRLDEFEVGDVVVAEYLQELVIEVVAAQEGDEPGEGAMAAAARAPDTERPGMITAETRVKTARVAEIDLENQTFKLDWGQGNVQQYVPRDPENLKRAEVGDMVIVSFTEALALQLQQAPEQE
jgi:hypothetical protein